MSQTTPKDFLTLQKCQKILNLFEELQPRKFCTRPHPISINNKSPKDVSMKRINYPKKYMKKQSTSNSKKSFIQKNNTSAMKDSRQKSIGDQTPTRSLEKKYFFSKGIRSGSKSKPDQSVNYSKHNSNSKSYMNIYSTQNRSLSIQNNRRNSSTFETPYKQQSRYEKIMKLKVKPTYTQNIHNKSNSSIKKPTQMSSYMSINSQASDKQNDQKQSKQLSRLEKIMKIKVAKPQVNSTLTNYDPSRNISKQSINYSKSKKPKETKYGSFIEMKQCKKKIERQKKQQDKEDQLWRVFQRQRQLRMKQTKKQQQKQQKDRRRKEKQFQKMIEKELVKIQRQKQMQKRRKQGFAQYVYPAC